MNTIRNGADASRLQRERSSAGSSSCRELDFARRHLAEHRGRELVAAIDALAGQRARAVAEQVARRSRPGAAARAPTFCALPVITSATWPPLSV